MKTKLFRIALVLSLVLVALAGGCQSAPGVKGSAADLAAIDKLWDQWIAACNTGNLDLLMSLWVEDGVRMAPDTPTVLGKANIRASEKPLFEQSVIKMVLYREKPLVSGNMAFSRGVAVLSMTPKDGGKTATMRAKYGTLLLRQADGSWKVGVDNFSLDEPVKEE